MNTFRKLNYRLCFRRFTVAVDKTLLKTAERFLCRDESGSALEIKSKFTDDKQCRGLSCREHEKVIYGYIRQLRPPLPRTSLVSKWKKFEDFFSLSAEWKRNSHTSSELQGLNVSADW